MINNWPKVLPLLSAADRNYQTIVTLYLYALRVRSRGIRQERVECAVGRPSVGRPSVGRPSMGRRSA
ncbi:hypothetical protein [Endozoicomonas sp. SCSIO W0465]|uniref:hypothetical protein n=1 Tax=Endozoicomonas sp. SCSIO W0465 TaxID=2918516 RepID=UPI00207519C7|nr:hypothetical protein [Endozoicomonas sp. SCSIO W0465]USE37103.1 hypothetical protein MJO57_02410 [Endozoicomonas sp. SCSIO W0465]